MCWTSVCQPVPSLKDFGTFHLSVCKVTPVYVGNIKIDKGRHLIISESKLTDLLL